MPSYLNFAYQRSGCWNTKDGESAGFCQDFLKQLDGTAIETEEAII